MTVICRPIGPGNWTPMHLTYTGAHMPPFVVRIGERFALAGVIWRVCEVRA